MKTKILLLNNINPPHGRGITGDKKMDTTYLKALEVAKQDGQNARKIGYAQTANPFKNTPFQNAWLHGWKNGDKK